MTANNLIKIVLLAPFRKFSKEREFSLEFQEGNNFTNLVDILVKKFGEEFAQTLLDENKQIHSHVTVMKAGKSLSVDSYSDPSEPLLSDQEYVFCAFMSGG